MSQPQPWGVIRTFQVGMIIAALGSPEILACKDGIIPVTTQEEIITTQEEIITTHAEEVMWDEQQVMRDQRNQEAPVNQERLREDLAGRDVAQQAMSVDPDQVAVSAAPPAQQEAALQDLVRLVEAERAALEALKKIREETDELLKDRDKMDQAVREAAQDTVNQAEVRPPPGPQGPTVIGPTEVYAGPYPVQDPRLTALDLKHAEDLHQLDNYAKEMEKGLKSRYEGSPDLDGYLKSFGETAEKQRESRLSEQAAERQQLRQEVYADQQRMINQQQQSTVPVPPPPMPPPPPIPPPTR